MPIVAGATPATAHDTRRTSGRSPSSAAFSGEVTTQTAAPSFCPDALPAVTVASGSSRPMIGLSRARASTVESGRMCSSRSTTASPFRLCPLFRGTVTGTISSANRPSAWAAAARRCERTANSSCSSRGMRYSRRRFSAVSIIPPGIGKFSPPAVTRPRARASWSNTPGPERAPQRIAVE